MRTRVGLRGRIYLALLGGAGTLVAHSLAFRLVARDAHHHSSMLLDTGHGYWGVATPLAIGLALAGLAGTLASSSRSQARFMSTARRVAGLQCVAFLTMETLERVSVGESLLVVTEPVVLVGLALQVAIALAATGLLVVLTRTLVTPSAATVLLPRPPTPALTLSHRCRLRAAPGLVYGGALLRAPPATPGNEDSEQDS